MRNIANEKFGELTALRPITKCRTGKVLWLCRCSCGKEARINYNTLNQNRRKTCGSFDCVHPKGKKHKDWKGCGEISGDLYNQYKRNSDGSKKRRILEWDLDIEFLWDLFLKQDGRCKISDISLSFGSGNGSTHNTSITASLDRIDNSRGYLKDNVQWLHKDVNMMKGKHEQGYFIDICRCIAAKNK